MAFISGVYGSLSQKKETKLIDLFIQVRRIY